MAVMGRENAQDGKLGYFEACARFLLLLCYYHLRFGGVVFPAPWSPSSPSLRSPGRKSYSSKSIRVCACGIFRQKISWVIIGRENMKGLPHLLLTTIPFPSSLAFFFALFFLLL